MHFPAVYRLRRYLLGHWRSAARGRQRRDRLVKSAVFYL